MEKSFWDGRRKIIIWYRLLPPPQMKEIIYID
jgi:hypothetical protein